MQRNSTERSNGETLDVRDGQTGNQPWGQHRSIAPTIGIDAQRLLRDLHDLRDIGRVETGVERVAFSPEDVRAREWVVSRLEEAGLEATIDGVGNAYGRWPGVRRALLVGSHTDTVPRGGWLDGALGVVAAIEVVRCLRAIGGDPPVGVDVISFADEEGTYQGELGSTVFCGQEIPEVAVAPLMATGWRGRPLGRLEPTRHQAYLELHIEQGSRLESADVPIGIVTGIVGMRRHAVTFRGRADHAGTTPMALRMDAGSSALRFAGRVLDEFTAHAAPDTVWNIGRCVFEPGAGNVVPSRAELLVEYRDVSNERLDEFDGILARVAREEAARHSTTIELRPVTRQAGTEMADIVVEALEEAAQDGGLRSVRMPSGAGHDAQVIGRHIPAGMLFVPSMGGRSHDPAEDTNEKHIVAGAQVLARAVARLLAAAT
jgi:N-carbamoyl-L-amino-acid hydrolase